MSILSPTEFSQSLPTQGRIMGIDLGSKTIGMALSDLLRLVATPFDTIRRTKFGVDSKLLLGHLDKHEVAGLVVGWPVEMSGHQGPRCQSTMAFVNNVLALRPLPILLWDERLSTTAVTRTLIEADTSRSKRAEVVDKVAAAYILQGALDICRTFGQQPHAESSAHDLSYGVQQDMIKKVAPEHSGHKPNNASRNTQRAYGNDEFDW